MTATNVDRVYLFSIVAALLGGAVDVAFVFGSYQSTVMWNLWVGVAALGVSVFALLLGIGLAIAKLIRPGGISFLANLVILPVTVGLVISNYFLFFLLLGFTSAG